jgi:hypothetical protein
MPTRFKLATDVYGFKVVERFSGYCVVWTVNRDEGLEFGSATKGTSQELELKRKAYEKALSKELAQDELDLLREQLEVVLADHAALPFSSGRRGGHFVFDSRADAKKAIAAARLAIKSLERPMPDWATRALAAGWKPPKGWKP